MTRRERGLWPDLERSGRRELLRVFRAALARCGAPSEDGRSGMRAFSWGGMCGGCGRERCGSLRLIEGYAGGTVVGVGAVLMHFGGTGESPRWDGLGGLAARVDICERALRTTAAA